MKRTNVPKTNMATNQPFRFLCGSFLYRFSNLLNNSILCFSDMKNVRTYKRIKGIAIRTKADFVNSLFNTYEIGTASE